MLSNGGEGDYLLYTNTNNANNATLVPNDIVKTAAAVYKLTH